MAAGRDPPVRVKVRCRRARAGIPSPPEGGRFLASELMNQPKPPPPEVLYFAGLDLGQAADYSAWVVTERTVPQQWDSTFRFAVPAGPARFGVRHIHRWHLGTSYTQVVADLKAHYAKPPLQNSTLAIDRTGVGRGVSDMVALAGVEAHCRPYTITGGSRPQAGTVPKKELVACIQVPLQERRLTFADKLLMTDVLQKELEHFKVKITESRNEQFECLPGGTSVITAEGEKAIEAVNRDDRVLTRMGYCRVLWSGRTKDVRELAEVTFSNGSCLAGTADHWVWTVNRGWVELAQLCESDECVISARAASPFRRGMASASGARVVASPQLRRFVAAVPVYDLIVEGQHEFFANGVLVHNSWRERDHDDLVLALALALYAGRSGRIAFAVGDLPSVQAAPKKPVWGR